MIKRIHRALAAGAASLSLPGIFGLGLLVCVGGFYFSSLRPEQSRLDELQQQIAQARERTPADVAAGPTTPAERLAAFYGFFPRPVDLPDMLGKVFAAAKGQGLQLAQGEYRVLKDGSGGLTQYQLTLPVNGTYPQIRKFVDAAMADVATLALDSIQFERQKVGEATVEAKIKFAVFLGKKS